MMAVTLAVIMLSNDNQPGLPTWMWGVNPQRVDQPPSSLKTTEEVLPLSPYLQMNKGGSKGSVCKCNKPGSDHRPQCQK